MGFIGGQLTFSYWAVIENQNKFSSKISLTTSVPGELQKIQQLHLQQKWIVRMQNNIWIYHARIMCKIANPNPKIMVSFKNLYFH